jgi:hypothetical protein
MCRLSIGGIRAMETHRRAVADPQPGTRRAIEA